MPSLLDTICVTTFTITDLHRRLGLLQECLEEVMYHGDRMSTQTRTEMCRAYATKIATTDDARVLSTWGEQVWESFTFKNLVEGVALLKRESDVLPQMVLYTPVVFDAAALELVGRWLRESVNPKLMLEVHVDASVTGGCAFVANSTYYDFSFRHLLTSQKGLVANLLSSYEK